MLLDVRTYKVKPGQLKAQFEVYAKYGKPAQTRHLGQPLAFLRTETGDPNEYVHIWVYENAADREKKRAAMMADPGWQDYLKRSAELGALVSQTNKLMTPVDFYDPPKT
ncbi:MAG: NIPSNAP family protein [Kiloniellaceae bacterium]